MEQNQGKMVIIKKSHSIIDTNKREGKIKKILILGLCVMFLFTTASMNDVEAASKNEETVNVFHKQFSGEHEPGQLQMLVRV